MTPGWDQNPWVAWSMGPVNAGGAPSISLSRYVFAEIDNFRLSGRTKTDDDPSAPDPGERSRGAGGARSHCRFALPSSNLYQIH